MVVAPRDFVIPSFLGFDKSNETKSRVLLNQCRHTKDSPKQQMRSSNSTASALGIDEETRVLILKKTWCHGQLVLPAFSFFYLYLFFFTTGSSFILLYAAFILPIWSYLSYLTVASPETLPSCRIFWTMASLAQLAHAGVFFYSLREKSERTSSNLLLTISSGLFFIETFAFFLVVRALGNRSSSGSRRQNLQPDFDELDGISSDASRFL